MFKFSVALFFVSFLAVVSEVFVAIGRWSVHNCLCSFSALLM
jgi:hypothetical protein